MRIYWYKTVLSLEDFKQCYCPIANIWLHFFIIMSDVMKWKIVGEGFGMKKREKRRNDPDFELWSWRVVTLQNYINYNDKLNELYGSVLFLYVHRASLTKKFTKINHVNQGTMIVKSNCFCTKSATMKLKTTATTSMWTNWIEFETMT